jgi:phosphoglucosamine mutase
MGATVHMLSNHPNGININRNCGSTHMERLQKYVLDNKLDCGLAFDGDADRFLCVDEKGNVIDGDMIMAICSLDMMKKGRLAQNTVVGTIMTNFGFTKFCSQNGIKFIATKVGDRFVLEEMNLCGYSLGGEQSGHIIFREYATTGDGQLTAVQLLSIMVEQKKSLSELASVMTKAPQVMINLEVSANGKRLFYTDGAIKSAMDDATAELGSTGRIVVRPSGTEPLIRVMAEGEDQEAIEKIAKKIADIITTRLGNK